MSEPFPDVVTPEQRHRNLVLGWLLAGFVLTVIVAFMVLFTSRGLPKNPEVVERLLREQSAHEPAPSPVAPPTSPIGADENASTVAPAQEPAR
jgi:hypothetical protein